MFFYLSFLRPPPQQSGLSGPLIITPQIANDLRTELYEDSVEIWYFWSSNSGGTATGTPPSKLTTWYGQSSAYKEIAVPLPPRLSAGASWSLHLHCPSSQPFIDLASGPRLGSLPFPVTSLPVLFSRGKPGAGKQEKIERTYRVGEPQYDLKITEQTSFDLDKKIWDSGIGLSSWLVAFCSEGDHEESDHLARLRQILINTRPLKILELGAGTGIVSLTIARIRSSINRPEGDVSCDRILTTDLASAMPLLAQNISANTFPPHSCPEAVVLDWEGKIPDNVAQESAFDLLVLADVTYNTAYFHALMKTINSLMTLSASRPPTLILGYKERHPDERVLWEMAKEVGLDFVKVGERVGAGGAAVEIWTASLKEKSV